MKKVNLAVLISICSLLTGCTFCYDGVTGLGADNVDANIKGSVHKPKASRKCKVCISTKKGDCPKCFEAGR